jgi:hypothetical protein
VDEWGDAVGSQASVTKWSHGTGSCRRDSRGGMVPLHGPADLTLGDAPATAIDLHRPASGKSRRLTTASSQSAPTRHHFPTAPRAPTAQAPRRRRSGDSDFPQTSIPLPWHVQVAPGQGREGRRGHRQLLGGDVKGARAGRRWLLRRSSTRCPVACTRRPASTHIPCRPCPGEKSGAPPSLG